MKTINNIKIIGVDAGYGNMKTANFCFRADSAATGGGVNGDYKAMAYPGAVKRLGRLCGEPGKDG